MLDRLSLPMKNGWFDEQNRTYIIDSVEDIMSDLQCGNQKAVNLLSGLEKKAGLIKRKRQWLGKPFHIDKQGNSEETADTGSKL